MKLQQITLENFGMYSRRTFEFGGAPLVVVYGANEAGKTTALNGIRQAVFGFKMRTPYLTGATMSAEVQATTRSGDQLTFTRRKGKQDAVSGHLGLSTINAEDLRRILGNFDLATYENLFGFSQDELRRGQETLKSAQLSEALAGGSLGGIHTLEKLRADLLTSLESLYNPRGSKPQINLVLSELDSLRTKQQEYEVLPGDIAGLRRSLRDTQLQSRELKQAYDAAFLKQSHVQKLLKAQPNFQELRKAEYELSQIDIPDGIDANFVAQWGDFGEQRKSLNTALQREQSANEAEEAELALLDGDSQLFDYEVEIDQLGGQAENCPQWRAALESLRTQIRDSEDAVARLLESLRLDAVSDAVLEFHLAIPDRREMESLAQQFEADARQLVSLTAKLDSAQETLRELELESHDDPAPENRADLTDLVERLLNQESEVEQQSRMLKALLQDNEFLQLEARLSRNLEAGAMLQADWKLPAKKTIDLHLQKYQNALQERQQLERSLATVETEIADLQSQKKQAGRGDAEEVLQRVESLSQQRDALIGVWLDELSQPIIAASLAPIQQEERLHELSRIGRASDEARNELLAIADAVAAASQHIQQLENKLRQSEELKLEIARVAKEDQKLADRWRKLWKDCPIHPEGRDQMLVWLRDYQSWQSENLKRKNLRRDLHIARSTAKSLRSQVLDWWPTNLRDDFSAELLREQTNAWENLEKTQGAQQKRRSAAQDSIERLTEQCAQLRQQQATREGQFERWLATTPVTKDSGCQWTLREAIQLMDGLVSLKREQLALQRAEQESAEVRRRLEAFEVDVRKLGQELGEANLERLPEDLATSWLEQLRAQRDDKTKHVRLTSGIAHRKNRIEDLEGRLQAIDKKLAALCTATGSLQVGGMASIMDQVHAAEVLRQNIGKLKAGLAAFCKADELDSFLQELAAVEEPSLRLQLAELQDQLNELEEQRTEVHQQIGTFEERIEQISNSREGQRLTQEMQTQRGQLAELAEQWVVERLAKELLSRSIDLFAQENEPALLRHTREYLDKLTGGRYVNVEHDPDKKGMFSVLNPQGERFEPDRLSTGTREQLYLALRMAFIRHHCEDHEPLPAVLDDCFVNFDDTRTRLALESIHNWDGSMQAILLSCHSRVPKILAEFAPETPCIHLGQSGLSTVSEVVQARDFAL